VAWLTRPMTTAVGFPAATRSAGNGASSQIAEFRNPLRDRVASLF
jgi:hypothetical protein